MEILLRAEWQKKRSGANWQQLPAIKQTNKIKAPHFGPFIFDLFCCMEVIKNYSIAGGWLYMAAAAAARLSHSLFMDNCLFWPLTCAIGK